MTTIIYDHANQIISYDSQVTSSNTRLSSNYNKMHQTDEGKWFCCGSTADIEEILKDFKPNKIALEEMSFRAFLVKEGKVYDAYINEIGRYKLSQMTYTNAIGSGCDFALAAMDFGRSAAQAVEYAATRDIYTGGEVNVFNVGGNN